MMTTLTQQLLLCLTIITASVVLLMGYLTQPWTVFHQSTHANLSNGIKFIVDTPGCTILNMDPFDATVRHMVRSLDAIRCNGTRPLTYINGTMLCINRTVLKIHYEHQGFSHCTYQGIHRSEMSDTNFVYGESIEIVKDSELEEEFIRVSCMGNDSMMMYTNFHAVVQRKKVQQNSKGFNVIMIGVDSISRLNFIRQLPKTHAFMLDVLGGVEYKGYNKVGDNTFVNLVPMFSGRFVKELDWNEISGKAFDDVDFVWRNYSQNGYVTAFAEDAPSISIFNYDKPGFQRPPTDHYLRPFSLALEDHRSLWNNNHDCFGPSLETDIVLNYIDQFVSRYDGISPFWAFGFITRLTHDNIHKASLADESYLRFFKKLHDDGHLRNAFVIFFSDHGMRFGEIRETSIGKLEERLPFLFMTVPDAFKTRYPAHYQNLIINSQRLTTPFDINTLLASILDLKQELPENSLSNRGLDLFRGIPIERTCDHAGIDLHWCTCYAQQMMDPDTADIQAAGKFIMGYINDQLKVHRGVCETLSLTKVTDARKITSNSSHFMLTIKTQPGGALFEATVVIRGVEDCALLGDISRINQYGDQSMCIEYHRHKKFCFCT